MHDKTIDWIAIRQDREQGLSLRTLATKYDLNHSYIGRKLGGIQDTEDRIQQKQAQIVSIKATSPVLTEPTQIQTQSLTATIARTLIKKIAKQVLGDLDAKEMKLLADTLSQCNKIIVGGEVEEAPAQQGIDWSMFTEAELEIIQPIFEQAFARQLHHKEQAS